MTSVEEKRRALAELRLRQRRAAQAAPPPARLVTLTAARPTSAPAFFCVHPAGGSAVPYLALARELGPDVPFHALESYGLDGGPVVDRLEEIASGYLAEIRQQQPAGPYLLGGWSIGGMIAFEVAGQLRDQGAQVGTVVMLDTTAPWPDEPLHQVDLLLGFVLDVSALQDRPTWPVDRARLLALDPERRLDAVVSELIAGELIPAELRQQTRHRLDVFLANSLAYYRYRARPYPGPLTLLGAEHTTAANLTRWRAHAPHLRHRVVPGDHYSMLRPPHVTAVAAALRECLEESP